MSFYKEVPGRKTTLESTLKFDTEPKADSMNPVTSEGVKSAIDGAVGDAATALQEQIDDIAEKAGSGYIPKGEATVATLNALSGQENGELYTMTDAGTLTDGSIAVVAGDTVAWDATNEVWYKAMDYAPRQYGTDQVKNLPTTITAFRTGDVIPVDGPSGTAKMSKDDLLKETAENALDSIHSLSDTATEDDLVAGNFLVLDGSAGTKKLLAKDVAKRSVQDNLKNSAIRKNAVSDMEWQKNATASGKYSYDVNYFEKQQGFTNRLWTKDRQYACAGDKIVFTPDGSLTLTVISVDYSVTPEYYTTLATLTTSGASYTFTEDAYIKLLVKKSDSSDIELTDFGNTDITIRQSVKPNLSEEVPSVLAALGDVPAASSPLNTKAIVANGASSYATTNYATRDGSFVLVKANFSQNTTDRLISEKISVKAGDICVFDGSSNSSNGRLLRYSSGSYSGLNSTSSSFVFVVPEDMQLVFDISKTGGYPLANYAVGSCILCYAMSAKAIEIIKNGLNGSATIDGSRLIEKSQFTQNGTKLLSKPISVKKDQWFIFDGTADSSAAKLLKYSGGSYSTIATSVNNKLTYQFTEDFTLFVDLSKSGTYSLSDYNDSCRIAEYMSSQTLKTMQSQIDSIETGGVTYYYANVKNGRLVAGTTDNAINRADYLAVEMPDDVVKVGCKWNWANGGHSNKGVVAMAVMPDTWTKKISGTDGITGKCLHLTITPTLLKVDFLGNDWGAYYYTNLINQAVSLSSSSSTEHEISMEISGESITVILDGVTYTGENSSDKSMSDVVGKYAFIEHWWQPNTDNVDMPEFSAFRVETATMVMFDAFAREPGIPAVTPQGLPYINLSNDSKGESTKTSYPDW